jgi:hypothetical protein
MTIIGTRVLATDYVERVGGRRVAVAKLTVQATVVRVVVPTLMSVV